MTAPAHSDTQASATGRHQRSARNYLLDPHFQLKYTLYLVAVAVLVSGALGWLLWLTSGEVIAQSQRTVEEGQETVRHGQQVVEESRKVSAVVSMNIVKDPAYADNPELAALFKENAAERDRSLDAEQARLKSEAEALTAQSASLMAQRRSIMFLLAGALSLLVVLIGLAGIIVTHKIAGPIYKMKRLLRRVSDGRYQKEGGLRKGDELQHFFDAFLSMLDSLRSRESSKIERLDRAIAQLEPSVDAEKLVGLRELRKDMQALLQD